MRTPSAGRAQLTQDRVIGIAIRDQATAQLEVPHGLPGLGAELAVRIALIEPEAGESLLQFLTLILVEHRLVLGPGALDWRSAQEPVAEMGNAHRVGVRG